MLHVPLVPSLETQLLQSPPPWGWCLAGWGWLPGQQELDCELCSLPAMCCCP
jgi:hypothetical protein